MLKDEQFSTQEIQSPGLAFMPDRPSEAGYSAAALKDAFGYALRVKDAMMKINKIIEVLSSQTGGDEIGVTVPGKPEIDTLRKALEYLLQLISANAGNIAGLDAALLAQAARLDLRIDGLGDALVEEASRLTDNLTEEVAKLTGNLTEEANRLEGLLAGKAGLPRISAHTLPAGSWAPSGGAYRITVPLAMAATDAIAWGFPSGVDEGQLLAASASFLRMDSQREGLVDFVAKEPPTVPMQVLVINYGGAA